MHERNRSRRSALTWESSRRKFDERVEMVKSFANQRGGRLAALLRRVCNLEQSLPSKIHRKRELSLVLHRQI